jgi:hypothetical protein
MKKNIVCLMIACLSLFAIPFQANAGTLPVQKEVTTETAVPPVITPAMEKKIDAFKKKHHEMFSKKDTKENSSADPARKHDGGVIIISGGALLLIIILLIILL